MSNDNKYTLTGKASVSFRDGDGNEHSYQKGDQISADERRKVPERARGFFEKTADIGVESDPEDGDRKLVTKSEQIYAEEAIELIGQLDSAEAVGFFTAGDNRATVIEAKRERLEAFEEADEEEE